MYVTQLEISSIDSVQKITQAVVFRNNCGVPEWEIIIFSA